MQFDDCDLFGFWCLFYVILRGDVVLDNRGIKKFIEHSSRDLPLPAAIAQPVYSGEVFLYSIKNPSLGEPWAERKGERNEV